jgi:hypothetical protein
MMMNLRSLSLSLLAMAALSAFAAPPPAPPKPVTAKPMTTAQYEALGAPSPDHRWTVADYIAASRAIATLPPSKLPRKGSAMFTRMLSLDNFVPLHDARPLEERGNIAFALLPPVRQVTEVYFQTPALNEGLDAEAIDAMEFTIAYFTEIGSLLDAKANTLPANSGPVPLRGVMAGIASSALERLVDVKSYRLTERVRLANFLATSLPALLAHSDPDSRVAIRAQLTAITNASSEEEIKRAVAKIAGNLAS